ncbi:TonB-dependent receptor [Sphingomonas sp. Root50]|nr:TonB-dependent receptor [Sphingomonas sp. Root1294]KQY66641.1 TonB-dependent receptor [Sphingomonas sp. Root50]
MSGAQLGPALAAPVEPQDEAAPGEIIVTAQKREQTLSDVPMSVTALSGEQLSIRGIASVESLVKVTPGLSYVESGNGVPVYSLRGVGFFDNALGARPTVSVYQDEVPLPFLSMAQGAALDLARVEVLKGPQGTLFGQNATGGAINYIAAKSTRDLSAGLTASYGRFGTIDANGYVSGQLASGVGFRASGRVLRGGDWQRSVARDASLGQKRFYQGRLLLELQPGERTSIRLAATGFRDKSDTQAAQLQQLIVQVPAFAANVPLIFTFPKAPADNRAADWDAGRDYGRDSRFYQFSARAEHELGDALRVTSLTAYAHMKVHHLVDQDGMPVTASLNDISGRLSSFYQELRFSGESGPVQFVVGGNYQRDKTDEFDRLRSPYTTFHFSSLPLGTGSALDLDSHQRARTIAAFANVDVELNSRFTVHGGLRYTRDKLHHEGCPLAGDADTARTFSSRFSALRAQRGLGAIVIPVGGCLSLNDTLTPTRDDGDLKEDNLSWRTGLDWKPGPRTLVYLNVSRAYKAGSASPIPSFGVQALAPVTQESVLAYEAGFKVPIVARMLEATGAVFYYDYSDKQLLGRKVVEPNILGALPGVVNVPTSRIKGAEFQVNAYPSSGLTLSVGGTYINSEVTGDFNNFTILSVPRNFKGDSFPYTPKYQLVADGQYDAPLAGDLNAMVGFTINYRSETNAGFGSDPRLKIHEYSLIDARTGIRAADRSWSATVFVRNLMNTYYWTNIARLSDAIRRYAGQPRTYGLELSTRF